jgi:hypothetical protein
MAMHDPTRRDFLRTSVGGVLAGVPLLGSVPGLSGRPSRADAAETNRSEADAADRNDAADSSAAPLRAFYASLSAGQRRQMCFAWDHRGFTGLPLRLHVTNNWAVSPASIASFSPEQQRLVEEVIAGVLSPGWPEKLKRQAKDDTGQTWGNQKVAIFGEPDRGPCQMVVTGFHLTLRATCEASPSAAFHGAICHGHQPSGFDEKVGHPHNVFWFQSQRANQVYRALDDGARSRALVKKDMPFYLVDGKIDRRHILPDTRLPIPLEPDVRFRGPDGTFPGLPIREMNAEAQLFAAQTLEGLLQPYRPAYRRQVLRCLEQQGGLEACSMAFYEERDLGTDREWDNWRIEGPAFVWYFRGAPHVHSWIHVADDPATPVTSHFG